MSSIVELQVKVAVQCGCYDTAEIIQRRETSGAEPLELMDFHELLDRELVFIAMIDDRGGVCDPHTIVDLGGSDANSDDDY